MRVVELKALTRERGLRSHSRLRKAELIERLQNNPPQPQTRPQRPTRPPPPPPQSVRIRPDRPRQPELLGQLDERQPSPQEMNIFEQQEMSKSRPQVTSKLNDWYDWLVNHVPKTIKDGASTAFKTFKDRIMGLHNRVTGNQAQLKGSRSRATADRRVGSKHQRDVEPEPFNPMEREQAFSGDYSYRL